MVSAQAGKHRRSSGGFADRPPVGACELSNPEHFSTLTPPLSFSIFEVTHQAFHHNALICAIVRLKLIVGAPRLSTSSYLASYPYQLLKLTSGSRSTDYLAIFLSRYAPHLCGGLRYGYHFCVCVVAISSGTLAGSG